MVVLFMTLFSLPVISEAFASDIEKDIQADFSQSKTLVDAIETKLEQGTSVLSELTKLKAAAEDIRISNLLLEDRFNVREEKAKALGSTALSRHQAMMNGYREALREYLSLIDSLPSDGTVLQTTIDSLETLLDKILPKKKRPLIGSLPYKHLSYPSYQPTTSASVTPAYLGGNKTVSLDDTAATPEAPISNEIATLAQSLNWNPVSIYEYVKNTIDTEWYWGCMKGAEDTLHQKSGNDCDQAALLTALLRASGFPTRYVRGVVQFFPDINRAKNLTGIDDPNKIAEFFQKAGIPYTPIIAGGTISNFQIEHVWVESQIPYSNYRGAIIDEYGKTWLGLDTSIKVKGYTYNSAPDILSVMSLSTTRNEYLGFATSMTEDSPFTLNQTPLDYLQASINAQLVISQATLTYSDYLRTRTLIPEVLNILPASVQFTLIKATNEYTRIPDELIHQIKFTSTDPNQNQLFTITLPSYKLSNQQIAISYEPETVEDQEIIDSYGGLDNTPAYLVHLGPVLTVNDERTIVAQGGVPMGGAFDLAIDLISPNGTQSITNSHIVGNLSVIGITAGRAVQSSESSVQSEKDAARLLYEEAMNYNDRWNKAEDELASLLHLSISRPIPSVVTLGGVIDVTYLLDTPHGFTWKGVFIDADVRAVEVVRSAEFGVVSEGERQKLFTQLSSLQGSILENRVFEDDFQVQSISTAKLFQLATGNTQLVTIDKSNIAAILPTLTLDDNIKEDIQNAVNQNSAIRIPQSEMIYNDWSGIGYIKENTATGESGWMLSGMIAGGMTAQKKDKWINQDIANELSLPSTLGVNKDPSSVVSLVRVNRKTGDYQKGTVGTQLTFPFEVMARDSAGKAVKNVPVTFLVTASSGTLMATDDQGNAIISKRVTIKTGANGIAQAVLTLGQKTADNPYWIQDTPNWTLAGFNQVSVSAQTGSGTIYTDKPFEAYGLPGKAKTISIVSGDGLYGRVNTFSGTAWSIVDDAYGNPVSNQTVTFTVQPQDFGTSTPTGADIQNAKIFGKAADCSMPATLSCQKAVSNLTTQTESQGAKAYIIMGNTDDTVYTIRATTRITDQNGQPQSPYVDFRHYVTPRPRSGVGMADPYLSVVSVYGTDDQGRQIDAGLPGKPFSAPLTAAMYFTKEKPADATNCQSTRTFTTEPVTDGTMQFNASQGGGSVAPSSATSGPNGYYATNLTLGPQPAKNTVEANGSVTRTVQKSDFGGKCFQDTIDYKASTTFDIWGVKATLKPDQLILINDGGYPVANTLIPYTIQPIEYQYGKQNIFLNIYENDARMGMIQADTNGVITISPGAAKFDITKTYRGELVVNSGGSIQIKSDKAPLPIGQIQILSDDGADMPMLGAVTDDVTTLKIQLSVKNGWQTLPILKWGIVDPQVSNASQELQGTLLDGNVPAPSPTVSFNSNGVAIVRYEVPSTFVRFGTLEETNDKQRSERDVLIKLNDSALGLPTIKLRRPPVVLVHGLWSSPKKAWKDFEPELKKKAQYMISKVDYEVSNSTTFVTNFSKVQKTVMRTLSDSKNDGFAATTVDIIGHSMGGLLARGAGIQAQTHKLITIDTPHQGSELAKQLVDTRTRENGFLRPWEKKVLNSLRKANCPGHEDTCLTGAVDDLVPGSVALNALPQLTVPMYTVVGLAANSIIYGYDSDLKYLWEVGLKKVFSLVPDNSFLPSSNCGLRGNATCQALFTESNDRIVSQTSQGNGGQGDKIQDKVDHVTVTGNQSVVDKVKELLEQAP